jgi:hypothetical protein
VGKTQESVTVSGNVPKVGTESGTISSVITGSQVAELNLVARTFVNLAILISGTAPDGDGFDLSTVSNTSSYTLQVNGVPGNYNNWDLGLTKNFQLPWYNGEHSNLQFRWETFNTFNHPQWSGVN